MNTQNNSINTILAVMSCKMNYGKCKILSSELPENIKLIKFYGGAAEEKFLNDNEVWLKCGDYYEDLPMKSLCILKYIYKNYKNTSVIKIDDNIKIFDKNQLFYISNKLHKSNINYCGQIRNKMHANRRWHFGKCKSDILNITDFNGEINFDWCDGGHGYYLSPYSIIAINNMFNHSSGHIYEDLMIGEYLGLNDIFPVGYSMLSGIFYDPDLSTNSLC